MKKIATLISAMLIGSTIVVAAHAKPQFNPDDVKQFEETNKCTACDLSNTGGGLISSNHSGAILELANFSRSSIPNINLSSSNLRGANFSGSDLTGANLSYSDVQDAHFDGASLRNANLFGSRGICLDNADVCNAILPDGKTGECH